jgi:4-amino-4-deoxy-L-arabinose transferase-like glycosyltransferase
MNKKRYVVAYLMLVSLVVRIAFWLPVAFHNVEPAYDEIGYYRRSEGVVNIVTSLARGPSIDATDIDLLYSGGNEFKAGWWPPLQSFVIAIGRLALGEQLGHIAGARLLIVILSALTTPFIYLTTANLFTRKSALAAGWIHIFFPHFIAYSHFLWSETLYIFILFATIYFVTSIPSSQFRRRRLKFAVFTGLFLGLGGLSRAAFLPYLIVFPLWLILTLTVSRSSMSQLSRVSFWESLLLIFLILAMALLTLLPWELILFSREGKIVLLSTSGGYNLYRGSANIPHDEAQSTIIDYAQSNSVSLDTAARILAIQRIKENPRHFLTTLCWRFRGDWVTGGLIVRHIFKLHYPPLPRSLALIAFILVHVGSFLLIAATCLGCSALLRKIHSGGVLLKSIFTSQGLIFMTVIPAILTPLLAINNPRLVLPALALFLPIAGFGITNFVIEKSRYSVAGGCIAILMVCIYIFNVQRVAYLGSSSYYAEVVENLRPFVANVDLMDRVAFKTQSEETQLLYIQTTNPSFSLGSRGVQSYEWKNSPGNSRIVLTFVGENPDESLKVSITSEDSQRKTMLEPVQPKAWRRWLSSGLNDIRYMWVGG